MTKISRAFIDSGVFNHFASDNAFTPGDSHTPALKIQRKNTKSGSFVLKNTGANILTYKIIGSMSETAPANDTDESWYTIKSDTDLAAGTNALETVAVEYAHVWVEAKNKTGGQANTLKIWYRGTSL